MLDTGSLRQADSTYDPRMHLGGSRPKLRALVGAALLAGVIALPSVAFGEPVASDVQAMPAIPGGSTPPDAPYGAISCPSSTTCTAAGPWGHVVDEGRPTVVTETNGIWGKPDAIALPSGGRTGAEDPGEFAAVSCGAVGDCLAVGGYPTTSSTSSRLPLVASESSGTWDLAQTIALPANALTGTSEDAGLGGAWCASAGNCIVVGFYEGTDKSAHLMAAVETSSVWAVPTELPAGPAVGATNAGTPVNLSCSAITACTVVSSVINLVTGGFTVNSWTETAGTWATPTQIPTSSSHLFYDYGLACPDATTCFAVGIASVGQGTAAAIATEASGTWGAPVHLAAPRLSPVTSSGGLLGIACAAMTCEAVGTVEYGKDDNLGLPMALTWANGSWSSETLVHGVKAGAVLATQPAFVNVSCASATQCVGVGGGGLYPYKSANEPVYPFSATLTPVRTPSAPNAPISVLAAPRLRGALVTWAPPYSDGGSPVTTFTATVEPGGRSCTTTGYRCTITGLADGHQYRVEVKDANAVSSSGATTSNPFFAGVPPTAPSHLVVTYGNGTATLSWHASAVPPGEPINRYRVDAVAGMQKQACATRSLTCTLRGLVKDRAYAVAVIGYDATGASVPARVRIIAR
jgi:hypothetical protein